VLRARVDGVHQEVVVLLIALAVVVVQHLAARARAPNEAAAARTLARACRKRAQAC